MADKENEINEIIAMSERLFDLYEAKINIGFMNSPQSVEERKQAYIDAKLLEHKIYLAEKQLKEIST